MTEKVTGNPENVSLQLKAGIDSFMAVHASNVETFQRTGNSNGVAICDQRTYDLIVSADYIDETVFGNYVDTLKASQDLFSECIKKPVVDYSSNLEKLGNINAGVLKRAYEAPDSSLQKMIQHELTVNPGDNSGLGAAEAIKVLKKVHGFERAIDVLSLDDIGVRVLVKNLVAGKAVIKLDRFDRPDLDGRYLENRDEQKRIWMRDAMTYVTGITDKLADDYAYPLSRSIFGSYYLDSLAKRVATFGTERIQRLTEFSGIKALSYYSDDQLERMFKLADHDESEITRLQNHDVIVVFIARMADHNGISEAVNAQFEDDAKRTLFFEVQHPTDVYRKLGLLHKMGIQPSSLVFSGHGSDGQFIFGEKPDIGKSEGTIHAVVYSEPGFISKREQANLKGYSLPHAVGFMRAVRDYMQPSRGIDDPDGDTGRKKIISTSCLADAMGFRAATIKNEKVIHADRFRTSLLRTLGDAVARSYMGGEQHVDVYGAEISTNNRTSTPLGFFYNALRNGRLARYPASVVHVDNGKAVWTKVDDVNVRRNPKDV